MEREGDGGPLERLRAGRGTPTELPRNWGSTLEGCREPRLNICASGSAPVDLAVEGWSMSGSEDTDPTEQGTLLDWGIGKRQQINTLGGA